MLKGLKWLKHWSVGAESLKVLACEARAVRGAILREELDNVAGELPERASQSLLAVIKSLRQLESSVLFQARYGRRWAVHCCQ